MSKPRKDRPRLYVPRKPTAAFMLVYASRSRSWVQFNPNGGSTKTFPPSKRERRITHLYFLLRWQFEVNTSDAYAKWGIEL